MEKALAITETMATQRKKLIEVKYKNEAALWESRSGKVISILALIGAAVGLFIGRKGFNLWSLRVQVFQDAILRKQAALESEGKEEPES